MQRGKYGELIDRKIWAFIDRTNDWYPPETIGLPVERQRVIYDAMCRAFDNGRPAHVVARDSAIDTSDHPISTPPCRRRWR
jgi:acetyl esterase